MKLRSVFAALLCVLLAASPAGSGSMLLLGAGNAGGGGGCSQATAFLARNGNAHPTETTALICGLVTDGVFAKLDTLYIFATDTSAHALLNLVSTSFNASLIGAPTFTADRGFTGTGALTAVVDTGFNPSTAAGLYTQNSAHLSAWSNTTGANSASVAGANGASITNIYPNFGTSDTYIRINDSVASGQVGTTAGLGWYMGSRNSSSNRDAYNNNTSLGNTPSATSAALANLNIYFLGSNANDATTRQITMGSIGGALTSTDAGNFYSRLRTYMTAVGVP